MLLDLPTTGLEGLGHRAPLLEEEVPEEEDEEAEGDDRRPEGAVAEDRAGGDLSAVAALFVQLFVSVLELRLLDGRQQVRVLGGRVERLLFGEVLAFEVLFGGHRLELLLGRLERDLVGARGQLRGIHFLGGSGGFGSGGFGFGFGRLGGGGGLASLPKRAQALTAGGELGRGRPGHLAGGLHGRRLHRGGLHGRRGHRGLHGGSGRGFHGRGGLHRGRFHGGLLLLRVLREGERGNEADGEGQQ